MNLLPARNRLLLPALVILISWASNPVVAQFEQKLSINLSGGYFNTMGAKGYEPDWAAGTGEQDPTLMPNFKGGYSFAGGIQYNHSRHFSIELNFGIMRSPGWYYDGSGEDTDAFNFLEYEITTTDTSEYDVIERGENEMLLSNMFVGISPRYYFRPGKKLNPFLFAGINLSYFNWTFINHEKDAYERLGRIDEYEESYMDTGLLNWFEDSFCVGPHAGAGIEYAVNDYLGIFTQVSYYFGRLQDGAFHEDLPKQASFHGINVHLGARISFLKSKEL